MCTLRDWLQVFACEPITFECGHHICKECDNSIENGSLKCKFCAKYVTPKQGKAIAPDCLFQAYAHDLSQELSAKYSAALDLYEGFFLIIFLLLNNYVDLFFLLI